MLQHGGLVTLTVSPGLWRMGLRASSLWASAVWAVWTLPVPSVSAQEVELYSGSADATLVGVAPLDLTVERERLLARDGAELDDEPIPTEPALFDLELEVLSEQRAAIDLDAITALQWLSAITIMLGATSVTGGIAFWALLGREGGGFLVFWSGIGAALAGAGGIALGLAEIDGNLHRARGIANRTRHLREARSRSPRARIGVGGVVVVC